VVVVVPVVDVIMVLVVALVPVVSVDIAVPIVAVVTEVSVVDIVPDVSVAMVSDVLVDVIPVSVAAVSVLAVSSFLQPKAKIATATRAMRVNKRDFFIVGLLLRFFSFSDLAIWSRNRRPNRAGNVSVRRSRGAIV
jgi:hypothetical protein